ncbi:hypothetical protein FF011L_17170 [Roseimaritima multifibrata]|uniref:Planctomycete cytochrome C n=1 Tax=Roseimaritima multifibrata TaxID=1930274 RepID=A0A517MDK2_9BACT|nr:DUF1592 domain-containing protein [Roseimaritima multifibrata]QDS92962.1 hypothetical protein FF011L_17170 [Roseimaritima multifibrata]
MNLHFFAAIIACRNAVSLGVLILFAVLPGTVRGDWQDADLDSVARFVSSHCVDCHASGDAVGNFDIEAIPLSVAELNLADFDTAPWERILRRIDTRQMPPPDADRPAEAEYVAAAEALGRILAERAEVFPRTGKVAAIRRMTRMEYQNAIRDLLGVSIDAASYLPKDEASHGFDNITVGELSPTHLNRYLSAAQAISRASLGGIGNGPSGVTIRVPADRSQEDHVAGLPFGTRGGTRFEHLFPQTGEYEFELKLTRDRDEKVEGLFQSHDIDVLVDREPLHRFTVHPPGKTAGSNRNDYTHVDSHLRCRVQIDAGLRSVGVTFPKTFASLVESKRQPFDASFNRHRHPRRTPAIYQISIVGPFNGKGPGNTLSRRMIFGDSGVPQATDRDQAKSILAKVARIAYRRNLDEQDLTVLMRFFDLESDVGFEAGIESGIAAILVNPNFLFRVEQTPAVEEGAAVGFISDFELASRLSYFLWSSLPDERLLQLAESQQLHKRDVLRTEVERMLLDDRSRSLVDNFASQWLYLQNLESITPDLRLFPDFDDNLRQAFQQETKHLFLQVLRDDRSVLDLIRSKHTFLNERLATHYGIAGVTGSEFRRVELDGNSHRGGILRHGSILMVTSYATRTSPTIRGNWVLENIFGTPAPPPPPDIPNLKEMSSVKASTVRERLAVHRQNPACASCHDRIDPVGFALENFDAVGRWRTFEGTLAVDSRGALPDGSEVLSVDDLENGIVNRPTIFARTLTEKLMTFALGRSVEAADGPAVRQVVQNAARQNYRFSSLLTEIVLSDPFRLRSTVEP